jgi:anti-sigma factor RsiW
VTTCADTERQLTAYLDGELDADAGTLVRGHLRGCADCRSAATAEAALRDGLRALPPRDPPPAVWAGIQAQLAAAEIAEAQRPRWRRALARWAPRGRELAVGGVAAAVAAAALWWRVAGAPPSPPERGGHVRPAELAAREGDPAPRPSPQAVAPVATGCSRGAEAADVTTDLAEDAARAAACHEAIAAELIALAGDERARWSTAERAAFEERVAALQAAATAAAAGRPQQRARRALIRYLQGAVVRADVVALAGGGAP